MTLIELERVWFEKNLDRNRTTTRKRGPPVRRLGQGTGRGLGEQDEKWTSGDRPLGDKGTNWTSTRQDFNRRWT